MRTLLLILFISLHNFGCNAQSKSERDSYTYKTGDRFGTGKWYMGREIAHVMGYQGINWLERDEREQEENTSRLLKNMDIEGSDVIADIGAGSGYHVFKMATEAEEIYAVDIQEEMLQAMRQKIEKVGIKNVNLIKGSEKSVNLPVASIDKVLMVDVYHEFSFPIEMVSSIKKSLNADGEIYLIEYRAEDKSIPIKKIHKMSEQQAVKEMNAAGFKLKKNIDNLPWQHCMIFIQQ